MKHSLRNCWRNRRVSLISVAVVLISALFLMIFFSSITTYQQELRQSYAALKASAHITAYPSSEKPRLPVEIYHAILDTGFPVNHGVMADYEITDKDVLRGVNGPDIDPSLRDCIDDVEWVEGYDSSIFDGTEMVCLMPNDWQSDYGDVWECWIGKNSYTFTVAGIYGNKFSSRDNGSVYYCPVNTLKALYESEGLEFTYCGMEMDLQNLSELDTFKAEMKALQLDTGDTRMVINDSQLQTITSQLQRQVRLLETLLPVLLTLIIAIGFGSSFLLLRGRKKEAAVLRSLGMSRVGVFGSFLLENLLQALAGLLLACIVGWCAFGSSALRPDYLAALLGCYLLGGGAAVWKISGVNVFNIMTARE